MGSPRQLINELVVQVAHDSGQVTQTEAFATFDRLDASGAENALHEFIALIDVGTRVTDGSYSFHLEESTDESAWTDVAADDVIFGDANGAAAAASGNDIVIDGAADDDNTYLISYNGTERWVRVAVDVVGATTGNLGGVVIWYLGADPRDMIR